MRKIKRLLNLVDAWGNRVATFASTDVRAGYGGQWGYVSDVETGLTLCGHRFYDATSGRWLTRDPIGTAGGINLYAYCGNNGVTRADPSGTLALALAGLALPGVGEVVVGVGIAVVAAGLIVKGIEIVADGPWFRGTPRDEPPTWDKPERPIDKDFPGCPPGQAEPGHGPSVTKDPRNLPPAIPIPHRVREIPADSDIHIVPRPTKRDPSHGQIEPKFPMPMEDFIDQLPDFLD